MNGCVTNRDLDKHVISKRKGLYTKVLFNKCQNRWLSAELRNHSESFRIILTSDINHFVVWSLNILQPGFPLTGSDIVHFRLSQADYVNYRQYDS